MKTFTDKYLYLAILGAIALHGSLMVFSFENTYDAYVHLFFAEHYAENWFASWNPKWYTGFNVTSYPPLVHQCIALLSYVMGLKGGFILWGFFIIAFFVRGVYRFAELFVPQRVLPYVAVLAPLSFSFTEALHIFGQLPSITGITFLLNACPLVYKWFRTRHLKYFFGSIALLTLTTTAHHVTTIFGMVFFILPIIGTATIENAAERTGMDLAHVKMRDFLYECWRILPRAVIFGLSVIMLMIFVLLPYWLWSKSDPITQIPIPHGSRANFVQELNLGLVFFVIPWGMMLFALTYLFIRFFQRRYIFFGLSFALAFLLGTGGTTPIPIMLLGQTAFDILTLDRFTFWASIMALPFFGQFIFDIVEGEFSEFLKKRIGKTSHVVIIATFFLGIVLCNALIVNLGYFKPIQPDKIKIEPIVNFLGRDDHSDWRYLTLGFGDQMAWLSTNTPALSVDGNYHSARRLPELTSRAVERLENAKYLGMEGLGALQQFLTIPESYNLKYVFSNDKFYEPLLFFSGWQRIGPLENGIVVWERPDIPKLPQILPNKTIPTYQRVIWGVMPLTILLLCFIIYIVFFKVQGEEKFDTENVNRYELKPKRFVQWIHLSWLLMIAVGFLFILLYRVYHDHRQTSPQNAVSAYFNAIDYKYFSEAYELLYPGERGSLEEYQLRLSVKDGILASYAKLDSLSFDNLTIGENKATIEVTARWITSVSLYESKHHFDLIRRGWRWYILPDSEDIIIPPDQYYRLPEVSFHNQGRRKIDIGPTDPDDIIDRPQILVKSALLVKNGKHYHIIGELTNIDNDPAYINVTGILYSENQEVARYNARDMIKHFLLPNESTMFRVDFNETQWKGLTAKFDPLLNDNVEFDKEISNFNLIVSSLVTNAEFYNRVAIAVSPTESDDQEIKVSLYNYGTEDINIPMILTGYECEGRLLWVDGKYVGKGVRAQRDMIAFIEQSSTDQLVYPVSLDANAIIVNGQFQEKKWSETSDRLNIKTASGCIIRVDVNSFVNALNN